MRKLASKMRDEIEEAQENVVDVRKDDKTIATFKIPFENFVGPIITINKIWLMNSNHQVVNCKLTLVIKKWEKYILIWPNWIGKSTLLKKLMIVHEHKSKIMKEYIDIVEKNKEDVFIKNQIQHIHKKTKQWFTTK